MHQGQTWWHPRWFPVPYHQDLVWFSRLLWCHPECSRVAFLECFLGLLREASVFPVPIHIPEYSPYGRWKAWVIAISVYVIAKGLTRGKSDFCPQATRASHSSSFPQIPQKEYLGSWDRSHQRASSGLLRASTTKGRSPLHFQSDQILQFLICVFKNLLFTSSASVHIDWRHSHDKDSLSGGWPLRQAAKRMTSRLRDVPGARVPPRSQTCSQQVWIPHDYQAWGLSKSTQ